MAPPNEGIISIIVPVYKVEEYLPACIDSLLAQTYPYLDILLIDDGSPDGCGEICDHYAALDERIRVFHQRNAGIAKARNFGIEKALEKESRFLGFIDGDDWVEPTMFQTLVHSICRDGSDISCCGWFREYGDHQVEHKYETHVYNRIGAMNDLGTNLLTSMVWNKLYQKHLFETIRFPEELNYEDMAVMHEIIFAADKVSTVPEIEYHYRVRSDSLTKIYSARNTIDRFTASERRYLYYKDNVNPLSKDVEQALLRKCARGVSLVWRWYHSFSREEQKAYHSKIKEIRDFTRENYPLIGYKGYPASLRMSIFMAHSISPVSFYIFYLMNKLYTQFINNG